MPGACHRTVGLAPSGTFAASSGGLGPSLLAAAGRYNRPSHGLSFAARTFPCSRAAALIAARPARTTCLGAVVALSREACLGGGGPDLFDPGAGLANGGRVPRRVGGCAGGRPGSSRRIGASTHLGPARRSGKFACPRGQRLPLAAPVVSGRRYWRAAVLLSRRPARAGARGLGAVEPWRAACGALKPRPRGRRSAGCEDCSARIKRRYCGAARPALSGGRGLRCRPLPGARAQWRPGRGGKARRDEPRRAGASLWFEARAPAQSRFRCRLARSRRISGSALQA